MTSQHSQQSLFNTMSYVEAFHANQSAQLAREKASRRLQNLVCGLNSSEPYAWYDQNTSSWKTYQRSLLTDWTSFLGTFTRQGYMNANGAVFQVALLELATKEIDGGSSDCLPTPTVCNDSMYYDKSPNKDKRHSKGLATQIIDREMLPTPTTMDHLGQRSPEALKRQMEGSRKGRTSLSNLREAVNPQTVELFNNLLPTPRASEPGRTNLGYGDNLKEGICKQTGIPTKKYPMLPTPTASDYKGRSGQGYVERHGKHRISDVLTQTGDNMNLNPCFVEEMMGYEIGWTDLKH